eukprot:UN13449
MIFKILNAIILSMETFVDTLKVKQAIEKSETSYLSLAQLIYPGMYKDLQSQEKINHFLKSF